MAKKKKNKKSPTVKKKPLKVVKKAVVIKKKKPEIKSSPKIKKDKKQVVSIKTKAKVEAKTKAEAKAKVSDKSKKEQLKSKDIPAEQPVQNKAAKILSPAEQAAAHRARQRALAKAKLALKEKEKQSIPIQVTDQAAFAKQQKLAEPKFKLELEYIIHASQPLLYEFITSPSGLSEWFADDVNIKDSIYTFFWEGAKQEARVLNIKENKLVRFQWTDRMPNTYFEFRIEKNELTEELSLMVVDFAENAEDMNSLEVLWQGQIQRLMKVIGSKI